MQTNLPLAGSAATRAAGEATTNCDPGRLVRGSVPRTLGFALVLCGFRRHQPAREKKDVENLRGAIGRFVSESDWEQFHSPKNLAKALSVEVSEVVKHFQWLTQE